MDKYFFTKLVLLEVLIFLLYLFIYTPFTYHKNSGTTQAKTFRGEGVICSYTGSSALNLLNPTNDIDSGISWGICQLGGIINNFVAYTPNLVNSSHLMPDGSVVSYNARDLLLKYSIPLSFALIPLILILFSIRMSVEIMIDSRESYSPNSLLVNLIVSILVIIVLPVAISFFLDLNNSIDQFILQHMIPSGGNSSNLTSQISQAINLQEMQHEAGTSIFPPLIESILLIGLFIALILLSFQFVIRYVLLWIIVLASPILLIFRIIPSTKSVIDDLLEKFFLILLIQPFFLLGLACFFQITNSENDIITKFFTGIGSLLALSLIPGIVGGITGKSIYTMGKVTTFYGLEGFKDRAGFIRNTFDKARSYKKFNDFGGIRSKD